MFYMNSPITDADDAGIVPCVFLNALKHALMLQGLWLRAGIPVGVHLTSCPWIAAAAALAVPVQCPTTVSSLVTKTLQDSLAAAITSCPDMRGVDYKGEVQSLLRREVKYAFAETGFRPEQAGKPLPACKRETTAPAKEEPHVLREELPDWPFLRACTFFSDPHRNFLTMLYLLADLMMMGEAQHKVYDLVSYISWKVGTPEQPSP
eukprot:1157940-Pelagomonas_calceolata.AAC.3